MTTTETFNRDQTVYRLISQIRQFGSRVQDAIETTRRNADAAEKALAEGIQVSGYTIRDEPVRLLEDMEPLCSLAVSLGVPMDAILTARRGEFVSLQALGIDPETA